LSRFFSRIQLDKRTIFFIVIDYNFICPGFLYRPHSQTVNDKKYSGHFELSRFWRDDEKSVGIFFISAHIVFRDSSPAVGGFRKTAWNIIFINVG
jgi:hypothetical protein